MACRWDAPLAGWPVAGDDGRGPLVAVGDEPEEEVRRLVEHRLSALRQRQRQRRRARHGRRRPDGDRHSEHRQDGEHFIATR
jgi:hypothetical protein